MNLSVQTPDERLAALAKPSVETVTQFALAPEDWLVICAGFEDRVLAVLQNAVSSQAPFKVLLVRYEPVFQENKADAILEIKRRAGIRVTELTYNRQEPAGFGNTLVEQLSACRGRIFVDVSAMSRLLIVQVLGARGARPDVFANCFVPYAEADDYPPPQFEAEAQLAKKQFAKPSVRAPSA